MATRLPAVERDMTPPEYADLKHVSVNTVLDWIKKGELRATNLASRTSRRPRYRISPDARRDFELSRSVVPAAPAARVRRKAAIGVRQYF